MRNFEELRNSIAYANELRTQIMDTADLGENADRSGDNATDNYLKSEYDKVRGEIGEFVFGEAFSCLSEFDDSVIEKLLSCVDENGQVDIEKMTDVLSEFTAETDSVDLGTMPELDLPFDEIGETHRSVDFFDGDSFVGRSETNAEKSYDEKLMGRLVDDLGINNPDRASKIYSSLEKSYDGNLDKMNAATTFAQHCDPASIKANSKEEVLERRINYDIAKDTFEDTKDKYAFRNIFASVDRLSFNIAAYRAGLPGAGGKLVTGGQIAINVLEVLRGNILDSIVEVGIKKALDKIVEAREAQVDRGIERDTPDTPRESNPTAHDFEHPSEHIDRSVNAPPEQNADRETNKPEPVFRENGSISPKATKDEIKTASERIDKSNPAGGNFCGADMKAEPRVFKGISTWSTDRNIETHTVVIDGKEDRLSVQSMRVADVAGNRYLVDPCGKAIPIEVTKPTTLIDIGTDGRGYIPSLDRMATKAESAKVEAYATANDKTVAEAKAEFSEKAVAAYIEKAETRIESHKTFLEGKVSEHREVIDGYKDNIDRLSRAVEELKGKADRIGTDMPQEVSAKAELEAKISELKDGIAKLEGAIDERQRTIDKYEATIERYRNAIDVAKSDTSTSDKLSAVIEAESSATGRFETDLVGLNPADVEKIAKDLEASDEVLADIDVAPEEVTSGENDSGTEVIPDTVSLSTGDMTENANTPHDSADGAVELPKGMENEDRVGQDDKLKHLDIDSDHASKKEVGDIIADKMESIVAAEEKLADIKDQIDEKEAQLEKAQNDLEQNKLALEECKANPDLFGGQGVESALEANIAESEATVEGIKAEIETLEAEKIDMEARIDADNKVISFCEDGMKDGSQLTVNDEGKIEKVSPDGKLETCDPKTGVTSDNSNEKPDLATSDSSEGSADQNSVLQDALTDVYSDSDASTQDGREAVRDAMNEGATASDVLSAINDSVKELAENGVEVDADKVSESISEVFDELVDAGQTDELRELVDNLEDGKWGDIDSDIIEEALEKSGLNDMRESVELEPIEGADISVEGIHDNIDDVDEDDSDVGVTSPVEKEEIKDAIVKYLDQDEAGSFSLKDDFLANLPEGVEPEEILDALNEVVEERREDETENERENLDSDSISFSDVLSDILDFAKDRIESEPLVELIKDIVAGDWEALGHDLVDAALHQMGLPDMDNLVDFFSNVADTFRNDVPQDVEYGNVDITSNSAMDAVDGNAVDATADPLESFDDLTSAVSNNTEAAFEQFNPDVAGADLGADATIDIPLEDFASAADAVEGVEASAEGAEALVEGAEELVALLL